MAQTRLRPGDMLARTGGDEFCIVLPASTLREGAMIARRIIDVCRDDAVAERWHADGDLRAQVRRLIRGGQALMTGGYRRLLQIDPSA